MTMDEIYKNNGWEFPFTVISPFDETIDIIGQEPFHGFYYGWTPIGTHISLSPASLGYTLLERNE